MSDVRENGDAPDIDSMNDNDFRKFMGEQGDAEAHPTEKAPATAETGQGAAEKEAPQEADDDDDDASSDGKTQETVPHGRFHRERERRKQAEEQLRSQAERYERLEGRLHQLMDMSQSREQPQEQRQPSYEDRIREAEAQGDFITAMHIRDERDAAREKAFNERAQGEQQQQIVQHAVREIQSRTAADFEDAGRADPAFGEAYQFLAQSSIKEDMQIHGISWAQANQRLQQRELTFYAQLLDSGRRPSEVILQMAKARGWQKQTEQKKPAEIEAEFEHLNKAKNAAKSLSSAGSEARTGLPSYKDIDAMSDSEFAAFKKKYGENAMRMVDTAA